MKIHTNLSMDNELLQEAKSKGLNLSSISEDALKKALNKQEVSINTEIEKCEFCGKEMRKATADNLDGLSWLYPDEKWICPRCLSKKSGRILK